MKIFISEKNLTKNKTNSQNLPRHYSKFDNIFISKWGVLMIQKSKYLNLKFKQNITKFWHLQNLRGML